MEIKKKLENNKIYLEVITSIVVLFVSIVVGVVSIRIANYQLEISIHEMNPYFYITDTQEKLDSDKFSSGGYDIVNIGGAVREIDIKIYDLIDMDHPDDSERYKGMLRVKDDYWIRKYDNLTGTVATFRSSKKVDEKYSKLQKQLYELWENNQFEEIGLDRNVLIQIRSKGKLGHESVQFFYNDRQINMKAAVGMLESSTKEIDIKNIPIPELHKRFMEISSVHDKKLNDRISSKY